MPAPLRFNTMLHRALNLHSCGELAQAEALCAEVLKSDQRNLVAMQLMGSITLTRGDTAQAVQWFNRCVAIDPRLPVNYCNLGDALAAHGLVDKALAQYDKAIRLNRDDMVAVANKAGLLERLGKHDRARMLLEPFVTAARESPYMAIVFARLELHAGRQEQAVEIATRHADDPTVVPSLRRQLHFELGRAFEKLGRIEESFDAYARANEIMTSPFDPGEYSLQIDRLIEVFTRKNLASLPAARLNATSAVFIVGMPRCGSTLVEQIIDAHPHASGVGESTALFELTEGLQLELDSQLLWPECVGDLTQESTDRLGKGYLQLLTRLGGGSARVVDKLLSNFTRLGLIQLLLPGAHVIHCRRDAMDTCFSCFVQNLSTHQHPYSSDLRHLGHVYREYERLMAHWRQELDINLREIVYEDLVAEGDTGIRRIIEFCGLPWDDRCLRFHESGRVVMTLSYDQVRRPMYRSSVRRCDRFAAYLGPLREALGSSEA